MDKSMILIALMAVSLFTSSSQAENILTGDSRLACEAILCLSSNTRPNECSPSLSHYFGIRTKKWKDTVKARRKFLNQCPKANQSKAMKDRITHISHTTYWDSTSKVKKD
jgi:hypothetical protein